MRSVYCVACAARADWDEGRRRYRCTSCRLAFEPTSVAQAWDDLPDLSDDLVTASLPELTDPGLDEDLSEDLSAPPWSPSGDVPGGDATPLDADPLVVWNLELEDPSEATTDGRIGS